MVQLTVVPSMYIHADAESVLCQSANAVCMDELNQEAISAVL